MSGTWWPPVPTGCWVSIPWDAEGSGPTVRAEELHSIKGELSQIKERVDNLLESLERMDQRRERLSGEGCCRARHVQTPWRHLPFPHPLWVFRTGTLRPRCPRRVQGEREEEGGGGLSITGPAGRGLTRQGGERRGRAQHRQRRREHRHGGDGEAKGSCCQRFAEGGLWVQPSSPLCVPLCR